MKIMQITPYFAPHHGGVESFVRDISKEFVAMGHSVTVLTSRYSDSLPERERMDGIEVIRIPLFATVMRSPLPRSLKSYLGSIDADIVHSHTPPPTFSFLASGPLRKEGRHTVLTYHCDADVPSRIASPFVRLADRVMTSRTVERTERIIVTSRTYASTSANAWKISSEIIPVSADTSRFHPDEEDGNRMRRELGVEDYKVVLFVGRLVRHKGVTYLIESMRYMDRDTMLLIVGDGEYRGHLVRYIASRGMKDRVRMMGDVEDRLLPSIYRAADVTVVPSTSRLEAFSIAAVESMASGTPLVVSDIPGVREVIEDGVHGFTCRPMDPEDLAEKVKSILSDSALKRSMELECVRRAGLFSSSTVAAKVLSVYRSLLGDTEGNDVS